MGEVAEFVVDHVAHQRVGVLGAGLGDEHALAVGAHVAVALALQGLARGALRLQLLRPRLAGRRRAQRVVRRQGQRRLGHDAELVRRHLGEAERGRRRVAAGEARAPSSNAATATRVKFMELSLPSARPPGPVPPQLPIVRARPYRISGRALWRDFDQAQPARFARRQEQVPDQQHAADADGAVGDVEHPGEPASSESMKSVTAPSRMRSIALPTAPPMIRPTASASSGRPPARPTPPARRRRRARRRQHPARPVGVDVDAAEADALVPDQGQLERPEHRDRRPVGPPACAASSEQPLGQAGRRRGSQ